MGLFSFIGDLLGGNKKAKAAKGAADVQSGFAQQGIDLINGNQQLGIDQLTAARDAALAKLTGSRDAGIASITGGRDQGIASLLEQMGVTRTDLDATLASLKPFIDTGVDAQGQQRGILGLNGGDQQASAIAALKDSPLFASLFRTGQDAILANGSATGGLRGGNIQRSLADFGSDTLTKVIEHQLSQLGGLRDAGINAAGTAGQARLGADQIGANLSGGIANLQSGAGTDIAKLQTGTGINEANLGTGTAQMIAQLLGENGVNIAKLLGDKGQAQAGGILGKANAYIDMYKSGAGFAGDIASAIMGMPGVGSSTMGQLAAKII